MNVRVVHTIVALALAALVAGCGWSAGLSTPVEGRSIGSEVFDVRRDVLERGLAPLLHEQMTRAAGDLVAAPVVQPSKADYVVRGTIVEYRRRSGIRNSDFQLQETALRIRLEAELIDRRTGEVVGDPVRTHVWSGYGLDATTNEAIALERALHYLAETVVLDLFGPASAEAPPDEEG